MVSFCPNPFNTTSLVDFDNIQFKLRERGIGRIDLSRTQLNGKLSWENPLMNLDIYEAHSPKSVSRTNKKTHKNREWPQNYRTIESSDLKISAEKEIPKSDDG